MTIPDGDIVFGPGDNGRVVVIISVPFSINTVSILPPGTDMDGELMLPQENSGGGSSASWGGADDPPLCRFPWSAFMVHILG